MTNTPQDRSRAKRQGQIYARELYNEEPPELMPIWRRIEELSSEFESRIDDLIIELAQDKIIIGDDPDSDTEEIKGIELDSTRHHLLKIIMTESILGEELDDQLEYNPVHGMVYDLRDPS